MVLEETIMRKIPSPGADLPGWVRDSYPKREGQNGEKAEILR